MIRLLAGTVVGGIVTFVLGFLIYGLLLDTYMRASMVPHQGLMKEQPDFILLIAGNLAFGLLLAFIIDGRDRTAGGGARLGLIIGLVVALYFNLMMAAFMNLFTAVTPIIVDVIASAVLGAVAGGVIGLVLGKMDSKPETA